MELEKLVGIVHKVEPLYKEDIHEEESGGEDENSGSQEDDESQ